MDSKSALTVAPELLAADIATLLGDKDHCRQYLDLHCGVYDASDVLLSASSTLIANKVPVALTALSEAPADVVDILLRFVYGEVVEIHDEGKLRELFTLARAVGVETCINKCRYELLNEHFPVYPISLCNTPDEKRQQQRLVRQFKKERRFADVTLCAHRAEIDDGLCMPVTEEIEVHAVMLAAASKYFAARWKHGFADGSAFTVDATAAQVKLLVSAIYGESLELCITDLLDLFSVADRWQVSRVSRLVMDQLKKEQLTTDLVKHVLTQFWKYPEPILHMVFITVGPQLYVMAPQHQYLEGTYKFACHFANDQPVWQQSNGAFLLYSGLNGHWCFNDNLQSKVSHVVSQYQHNGRMPHEMDGSWKSYDGQNYIHDGTVVIVEESQRIRFLIHDIISEHVGLAVQILSGSILGSIGYIKRTTTVWVEQDNNLQKLVASLEWLQLDVDKLAILYTSLIVNDKAKVPDGHWKHALDAGVVNWAREGASSAYEALTRLLELTDRCGNAEACKACKQMVTDLEFRCRTCDAVKANACRHMVTSWTSQLMQAYGDDAFPLVEQIIREGWSKAFTITSSGSVSQGHGTKTVRDDSSSSISQGHGTKRVRDDIDESIPAIFQAVASWSSPRLKRLCTEPVWSSARPEVLAAILRFEKASIDRVDEQSQATQRKMEMKEAADSWVHCATLASILEVMAHLGTSAHPDLFDTFLTGAKERANALQKQAEAVHKAQDAQREAEERVAAMVSKAQDLKVKLIGVLEDHCLSLNGKAVDQ